MPIAAEFREVGGIYHWEAYEPKVKANLSSCAVVSARGLIFIDPIPLARDALARLRTVAPPAAIVLTNGNHRRAADRLREELQTPVFAHPDAAAVLDLQSPLDGMLADGDLVGGDVRVISLPGAGPGEISFLSAHGVVHVGDALIHADPYGFSVLPAKYCEDIRLLRDSLLKLLRFEFDLLTFAHGHPLTPRAKQYLARLLT